MQGDCSSVSRRNSPMRNKQPESVPLTDMDSEENYLAPTNELFQEADMVEDEFYENVVSPSFATFIHLKCCSALLSQCSLRNSSKGAASVNARIK